MMFQPRFRIQPTVSGEAQSVLMDKERKMFFGISAQTLFADE
ncbi:unnamed protein product [Linum tenue]|uniref:Uncharacterized protein n=1 Tax=Linum tenue TaxID=586396 RepID=A0AAV0R4I4_9ROSI|nr:unnamed protein product [Linum tenue]